MAKENIAKAKEAIEKILVENNVRLKAAGFDTTIFLVDKSDNKSYTPVVKND